MINIQIVKEPKGFSRPIWIPELNLAVAREFNGNLDDLTESKLEIIKDFILEQPYYLRHLKYELRHLIRVDTQLDGKEGFIHITRWGKDNPLIIYKVIEI